MTTISSTQRAFMNLDIFKTTPANIGNPETSSTRSVSPLTANFSASAKRRRSVSSMKGLMPLALSTSSSSPRSSIQPLSSEDDGADGLEDSLPELLARDLEMSADVFASKDMTAGAPSTGTTSDEHVRARASRVLLHSPYLAASARVQILGAIEERESMVSFINHDGHAIFDHHSDSASVTSHDSSEEAEPPSFRHRGSVVTTATSVGSIHCKPTIVLLPERSNKCNWMDADSDREDRETECLDDYNAGSLSPRPRTPQAPELASSPKAAASRAGVPNDRCQFSPILHRKSHSVNGDFPDPTCRRHFTRPSPVVPHRSSSIASLHPQPQHDIHCTGNSLSESLGARSRSSSKTWKRAQSLSTDRLPNGLFTARARDAAFEPGLHEDVSPISTVSDDSDDEALPCFVKKNRASKTCVFVRPPSPPHPLRSVQSWLNSSLQPYPWTLYGEDSTRAVPLPPDAVENLRISVACFPETMLLTSSLTVETIRSYAKKVRRPSMDSSSIATGDASSPEPQRRSLWRKVVLQRRRSQQFFSEPKAPLRPYGLRHEYGPASTPAAYTDSPKPWLPLKSVFGCCSDYICDALYAHIVAYNYVSALVVRSPRRLSGQGRSTTTNTRDLPSQDDIPKKAASLLGISAGDDMAGSVGRFSQRLSSPLGDWTREGMVTQQDTITTAQDNALCDIQSGLLRCISKLVTTARLMAEKGTGEENMVEMEAEDTDMLFMRSLCEIVKMAEDSL